MTDNIKRATFTFKYSGNRNIATRDALKVVKKKMGNCEVRIKHNKDDIIINCRKV